MSRKTDKKGAITGYRAGSQWIFEKATDKDVYVYNEDPTSIYIARMYSRGSEVDNHLCVAGVSIPNQRHGVGQRAWRAS